MLGYAQEVITEGVVTSKQTMSSDNEQMNQQLAMIGDMVTTTYFKDDKTRTELSGEMTGDVVSIFNTNIGQMMMMMDNPLMGKKYVIKAIDNSEDGQNNVEIKKGNEVRTILGYECQKYTATIKDGGTEVVMDMFMTNAISAINKETMNFGKDFDGGFPLLLEISTNAQGMNLKIKQEVISVNKESVSDEKFDMTAPEGFEKVDTLPGM
jgi:hypothetical protein